MNISNFKLILVSSIVGKRIESVPLTSKELIH